MTEADVIKLTYETLIVALKVSAPVLLVSLVTGLIISILQTTTSIQEQTLTFVPKLIAIFFTLLFLSSFLIHTLVDFTTELFQYIVRF
ncbi:MAG: flagellar biosynthesis protein FliQ [Leptonema sp. (in: bacteria)]